MVVNNETSAHELVTDWEKAAERHKGLGHRANVTRFRRFAQDQRGCAAICRTYKRDVEADGYDAAAKVLETAAHRAEMTADAREAVWNAKREAEKMASEAAMKAAYERQKTARIY